MIIPQPNTNLLLNGDCLDVLKELPDNSVDSIVTDPPYGLGFMGKQWDTFDNTQFGIKGNEGENDLKIKKNFNILPRYCTDGLYDFTKQWATECLRVLKHGGYLLSFSGTRTYHKICMGIEDAGFEVRDMIEWVYGSGFPKSLNVAKMIEGKLVLGSANTTAFKHLKGERADIVNGYTKMEFEQGNKPANYNDTENGGSVIKPEFTTEEAKKWNGYGTALKPAHEPIVMARKPLAEKTVAENVLKYGTGGINIDGSRVGSTEKLARPFNEANNQTFGKYETFGNPIEPIGRFPANLIHDGSEEVLKEFEKAGISKSQTGSNKGAGFQNEFVGGIAKGGIELQRYSDSGTSARFFKTCEFTEEDYAPFFYTAKASRGERNEGCDDLEDKPAGMAMKDDKFTREHMGNTPASERKPVKNNHPTVKPVKLMEYLIKLVTPKGGVVLDPFAGSGTTGLACIKEGMNYILIEKELEYIKIATARLAELNSSTESEVKNG